MNKKQTSPKVAKIASKALRGEKITKTEAMRIGGSALAQTRSKTSSKRH